MYLNTFKQYVHQPNKVDADSLLHNRYSEVFAVNFGVPVYLLYLERKDI